MVSPVLTLVLVIIQVPGAGGQDLPIEPRASSVARPSPINFDHSYLLSDYSNINTLYIRDDTPLTTHHTAQPTHSHTTHVADSLETDVPRLSGSQDRGPDSNTRGLRVILGQDQGRRRADGRADGRADVRDANKVRSPEERGLLQVQEQHGALQKRQQA
ncbi:hypothetical protein EsHS_00004091 [Epichloe bromicola]